MEAPRAPRGAKEKSVQKISWRLLAFLALLILSPSSRAQSQSKITIEIPVFAGGEGMTFFTDCAREYEKLHPDVDVNLYGDNRVDDKVRIRVLEGTLFDITNASLNWWGLIKRGDVEPLDAALDQTSWDGDTSWRDSFVPGSLSVYQYQGKTYALPLCWFVSGVWYNKVMFREHGWNKPKNWDEFFQLCNQIKQAHVVYDPKTGTSCAPLRVSGAVSVLRVRLHRLGLLLPGRAGGVSRSATACAGKF